MNAIYKQSGNAIVWLGEWDHMTLSNNNAIQETYQLLEDLASNRHCQHIPQLWDSNNSYDKARSEVCSVLEYLASKSYWNRAWIVQEFILPNQADIVCGPFSMRRDVLAKAGTTYREHVGSCCNKLPRSSGNLLRIHKVLAAFNGKFLLLDLLSQLEARGAMERLTLWELLSMFRITKASDHRDKIIAFLGLAKVSPAYQQILPDYSVTTHDLYTMVGLMMLNDSQSILILTQCTKKASYPKLPSWIPDWTTTEKHDPLFIGWCHMVANFFDASGLIPAHKRISEDIKILMMSAIKIGTVKNAIFPDTTAILHTLTLWDDQILASVPVHGSTAKEISATRRRRHNLIRTAIGGYFSTLSEQPFKECVNLRRMRRVWDEDLDVLDKFLAQAKAGVNIENIKEHPNPLYTDLWNSICLKQLSGEKLLIIDHDFIGLGQTAQEGDEVWIMPSSPVPIVLRPFKTNASDGGKPNGLHQLVGHCYIDGVMDGEATENYEEKLETVRIA